MRIDVPTVYSLLVGTLLLLAALTFWESRSADRRRRELLLCGAALVLFAGGCAVPPAIAEVPPFVSRVVWPVLIAWGYATLAAAAASLSDRRGWLVPLLVFCATYGALLSIAGPRLTLAAWYIATGMIIMLLNLVAGSLVLAGRGAVRSRARPVLAAVFFVHAAVYGARVVLISQGVLDGPAGHSMAVATMFEALIYAVAVPSLFLTAIREEREHQLVTVSRTDFLTGLDNRRAFADAAERLASDGTHTLLLADLDHFKRVNDGYGHEAGDEMLKLFARVAAAELPAGAPPARLGGEEFAALLPGMPESARETAERLAARFREASGRVEWLRAPLTVSIGLSPLRPGPDGLETALAMADRALYRAKAGGRNRVEIALAGQVVPLPVAVTRAGARPARTPWWTGAAG